SSVGVFDHQTRRIRAAGGTAGRSELRALPVNRAGVDYRDGPGAAHRYDLVEVGRERRPAADTRTAGEWSRLAGAVCAGARNACERHGPGTDERGETGEPRI